MEKSGNFGSLSLVKVLLDDLSLCQNAISRSHGNFSEVRENESPKTWPP